MDAGNMGGMKRPSSDHAGVGSAHGKPGGTSASRKKWTVSEKLRAVVEAAALSEKELGEFLRREGLHEAELRQWRAAAEAGLAGDAAHRAQEKSERAVEVKRMKALERELRRKEKALAEAAALLVLKKKVREIWGDEDDSTAARSDG